MYPNPIERKEQEKPYCNTKKESHHASYSFKHKSTESPTTKNQTFNAQTCMTGQLKTVL